MFDDLRPASARSSRRRRHATDQSPSREATPLRAEELVSDKPLEASSKAVFWDTVAIASFTTAVLVGGAIGVPLGIYLHRTL
ncbi:hypothetical protein FA341_15100 [Pseudomonas aeruginosa]|nr:hypothetical protein F1C11_26655 [Pseudomonas aeruginosa]MCO2454828.1 hypothetical protein [Pseudomonas aeruginosa]OTI18585.1 hypothetical protein CAY89_21600 [Pseudomonas aeruginosa]OTI37175.1 hypothetical protein CAY97_20620 [Pseudomonas aeruginosa]OTI43330.1 hypothetical protein CAZ18_20910 [Pseudomonas aeruginosa]